MRSLENKIPPPLVAVAFGAAMWGVSDYLPGIEAGEALRIIVAALVVLIGGFFCLAGVVSFRRAKTTVNPLKPEAASALVSSGIYKISRNPMYVGFALFLVAWAVYLSSLWALVGVIGFVWYIDRFQIQPEERALAALFAAEFERYKSSVRRWL
jgi:protein-S-isoprenylcysteine O-methyltransferase Ste14